MLDIATKTVMQSYTFRQITTSKPQIHTARVVSLRGSSNPNKMMELHSLLGMCNVFRRFIAGYGKIAAPLYKLTKKGQTITLVPVRPQDEKAGNEFIERGMNPPVLTLRRKDVFYSVDTAASDQEIGAALSQEDKINKRKRELIGYWQRRLNEAEREYSTPEKECLAIVWALPNLRPYLPGSRFQLNTDRSSVRWLLSTTDGTGRLLR